jgi:hypothetical protein
MLLMSGLGKDGRHGFTPKRNSKGVGCVGDSGVIASVAGEQVKKFSKSRVVLSTKDAKYFLTVLFKTSTWALH